MRSTLPLGADRELDVLVDEALQESSAERNVVALDDHQLEGLVGNGDRLARLGKSLCDLLQVVSGDLAHLTVRERREQHDLVDAIAELRREAPFELAHHLALDLFRPDAAL